MTILDDSKQEWWDYWWPGMIWDVNKYIDNCLMCLKVKPVLAKPVRELKPTEVPSEPWESILVDFVINLPKSARCGWSWMSLTTIQVEDVRQLDQINCLSQNSGITTVGLRLGWNVFTGPVADELIGPNAVWNFLIMSQTKLLINQWPVFNPIVSPRAYDRPAACCCFARWENSL